MNHRLPKPDRRIEDLTQEERDRLKDAIPPSNKELNKRLRNTESSIISVLDTLVRMKGGI